MLVVAAFGGVRPLIAWARENLQNRYGPIVLESEPFDFVETQYYDDTMGGSLTMHLFAFERLIRPEQIGAIKLATNELERLATQVACREPLSTTPAVTRPINLDPGYLHSGKWVLATTKDQAHRIYLGGGIYGEVTLRFERGEFVPWPWTYPNYRRGDYRAFLKAVRTRYLRLLRGAGEDHSSS
jgi:hypothetical protein